MQRAFSATRLLLHLTLRFRRSQELDSPIYGLDSIQSRVLSHYPAMKDRNRFWTGIQRLIAKLTTRQLQKSRIALRKAKHIRSITPCACTLISVAAHGISFSI